MMATDELYQGYYELAVSLRHQHRDDEKLTSILIRKGCDVDSANKIIVELNRIKNSAKRQTGVKILIFGCLILFIGFVLTCLCFHFNTPIHAIMYGFTSVGLLILFVGLMYIF